MNKVETLKILTKNYPNIKFRIYNNKLQRLNRKRWRPVCKCGIARPIFGLPEDKKPTCCSKCRSQNMIDITHKKCICGKAIPIFGLPNDKRATCCYKCKSRNMIDIINKKCICGKTQPSFGLMNDKRPTCCSKCKEDNMIDINHKKCICGIIPSFGLPTDKTPTCCSSCKKKNMIDIIHKRCSCGKSTTPCFGLATDKIATCCAKCKTNKMINIVSKRCSCGTLASLKKEKATRKPDGSFEIIHLNLCSPCAIKLGLYDPTITHESEKRFQKELELFKNERTDKIYDLTFSNRINTSCLSNPNNDCKNNKCVIIDAVLQYRKIYWLLENDENRHNDYILSCELNRMCNSIAAIRLIARNKRTYYFCKI